MYGDNKERQVNVRIHIRGNIVRQVTEFKLSGSLVSEDGRCKAEIKSRLVMSKTNFTKMSSILTNMRISIKTRSRELRCFVWSGMLDGCETWTVSKATRQIEAAEMWFWKRVRRMKQY